MTTMLYRTDSANQYHAVLHARCSYVLFDVVMNVFLPTRLSMPASELQQQSHQIPLLSFRDPGGRTLLSVRCGPRYVHQALSAKSIVSHRGFCARAIIHRCQLLLLLPVLIPIHISV